MKFTIYLILALNFFISAQYSKHGLICDMWSGWADIVIGENCSNSIIETCVPFIDVLNDLKNAIIKFDFKYLYKASKDMIRVILGLRKQLLSCRYAYTLGKLLCDSAICIVTLKVNYTKVLIMMMSSIYFILTGSYESAGIILGIAMRTFAQCRELPQ